MKPIHNIPESRSIARCQDQSNTSTKNVLLQGTRYAMQFKMSFKSVSESWRENARGYLLRSRPLSLTRPTFTHLPFSVTEPDARDHTKIGRCHHWRRWWLSIGRGGNKHQGPKGLLAVGGTPLGWRGLSGPKRARSSSLSGLFLAPVSRNRGRFANGNWVYESGEIRWDQVMSGDDQVSNP